MTLEELEAWPKATVGTKEASELLGCSRWGLTLAAKQGQMGTLEYFFSGNRLHISKNSLIEFVKTGPHERDDTCVI